jgi:hypothetical protein
VYEQTGEEGVNDAADYGHDEGNGDGDGGDDETADGEVDARNEAANINEISDGDDGDGDDIDDDDEYSHSDPESYISSPRHSGDEGAVERYEQRRYDRQAAAQKAEAVAYDRKQEAEIAAAYCAREAALLAGESIPVGCSLYEGGRFELFCADYYSHYYADVHVGKYLFLSQCRAGDQHDYMPGVERAPGQICGQLSVYPEGHFSIDPFYGPVYASAKPVVGKEAQQPVVNLFFFGSGYLKLSVELALLLRGKSSDSGAAGDESGESEMIVFWGKWVSDEERRRRRLEASKRSPPPSPKWSVAESMLPWHAREYSEW